MDQKHTPIKKQDDTPNPARADRFTWNPGDVQVLGKDQGTTTPKKPDDDDDAE